MACIVVIVFLCLCFVLTSNSQSIFSDFRCRRWVQNSRRKDLLGKLAEEIRSSGCRLCADHFEPTQFNVPAERKRLVWNAVPTIFNIPNPPPQVTSTRPSPRKRSSPRPSHPVSKRPRLSPPGKETKIQKSPQWHIKELQDARLQLKI